VIKSCLYGLGEGKNSVSWWECSGLDSWQIHSVECSCLWTEQWCEEGRYDCVTLTFFYIFPSFHGSQRQSLPRSTSITGSSLGKAIIWAYFQTFCITQQQWPSNLCDSKPFGWVWYIVIFEKPQPLTLTPTPVLFSFFCFILITLLVQINQI
jgi:hypothetical protein